MSDFASTWAKGVVEDWEAGDLVRTDKLRDQVFQPLMFLGTSHDHSGDDGDGATLAASNPVITWLYAQAAS